MIPDPSRTETPLSFGTCFKRTVPGLIVLFGMLFLILGLYDRMWILLGGMIFPSALVLYRRRDRKSLLTYGAAAVLGPLGEYTMIAMGYWNYNMETYYGIPLWLPLVWGNLFVVFNELAELTEGFLSSRRWFEAYTRRPLRWILSLGVFVYLYLAGRQGVAPPFLLAFAIMHLLTLRFFSTRQTVAAMFWSALVGVTGEVLCTLNDVWIYHKAVLGLIPLTLPLAWAYSAVVVRWIAGFPLQRD